MAEKGGKGFSLSNAKGKRLSSAGKGGGKETNLSSGKAGRRRAQVSSSSSDSDSDVSLCPITPSGKADWDKGGPNSMSNGKSKAGTPMSTSKSKAGSAGFEKAGVSGNGGKTDAVSKVPETPKFEVEGELPKNAKCMLDCEAEDVLLKIQEHLVILSEDPSIKLPESFDKGLQYAKLASGYKNPESVRKILETLKNCNVSESDICLIGNICPEGTEEVYEMMPWLKEKKKKNERALEEALRDIAKFKKA